MSTNKVLLLLVAATLLGCADPAPESQREMTTEWLVTQAAGMDALLLIGAASGDVMQAHIYPEAIAFVRDNMSEDGLAAMAELDATLRQKLGQLTGPTLAYVFSAGPIASLEDVIESAADPVGRLQPGLEMSPHWDAQEFEKISRMMPTVHRALTALRDIGFNDWYASTQLPNITPAVQANKEAVQDFDVIPEQERLLGRTLDPGIEIVVVGFARPYGMRILGQRFVAYYAWEANIQLRVAAHELFHPPYDPDDAELAELLTELEQDTWMNSIVENHDPKFGYNSFMGVVNEGSTQALDQIVSDRLGFAEDPGERWRESDGGMHMLAAALYHAMREDGFPESGGNYSEWFKSALRRGLLDPASVKDRATTIVGAETVALWDKT